MLTFSNNLKRFQQQHKSEVEANDVEICILVFLIKRRKRTKIVSGLFIAADTAHYCSCSLDFWIRVRVITLRSSISQASHDEARNTQD